MLLILFSSTLFCFRSEFLFPPTRFRTMFCLFSEFCTKFNSQFSDNIHYFMHSIFCFVLSTHKSIKAWWCLDLLQFFEVTSLPSTLVFLVFVFLSFRDFCFLLFSYYFMYVLLHFLRKDKCVLYIFFIPINVYFNVFFLLIFSISCLPLLNISSNFISHYCFFFGP